MHSVQYCGNMNLAVMRRCAGIDKNRILEEELKFLSLIYLQEIDLFMDHLEKARGCL